MENAADPDILKTKEVIMPGGDRTGPYGEGSLTGRRMGYCAGYDHPGYMNVPPGWGRGYGPGFRGYRGRGPGLGFRHRYGNYSWRDYGDVSEKTLIENEIRVLKDQLSALEDRLSKIGREEKKGNEK